MSKLVVKCNYKNIGDQLFKSEWAMSACRDAASSIAARAGKGFEVEEHMGGKSRVNAAVVAVTEEARSKCLKENTLLKALGG